MELWYNEINRVKSEILRENLAHCHFYTPNLTFLGAGSNPGFYRQRKSNNSLNCSTGFGTRRMKLLFLLVPRLPTMHHFCLNVYWLRIRLLLLNAGRFCFENEYVALMQDTDRVKSKYCRKNLSWCHRVHHKCHVESSRFKPGRQY
jgi:hypothetical protein